MSYGCEVPRPDKYTAESKEQEGWRERAAFVLTDCLDAKKKGREKEGGGVLR